MSRVIPEDLILTLLGSKSSLVTVEAHGLGKLTRIE